MLKFSFKLEADDLHSWRVSDAADCKKKGKLVCVCPSYGTRYDFIDRVTIEW